MRLEPLGAEVEERQHRVLEVKSSAKERYEDDNGEESVEEKRRSFAKQEESVWASWRRPSVVEAAIDSATDWIAPELPNEVRQISSFSTRCALRVLMHGVFQGHKRVFSCQCPFNSSIL